MPLPGWAGGYERPKNLQQLSRGAIPSDPFATVWPMLLGWLEDQPDLEAKAMLKRLQASGHGHFPDGQLRTLRRRVRVWRMQIVRHLIYGAEEVADPAAVPLSE